MKPRKTDAVIGILILLAYSMLIAEATDSKPIVTSVDVISGFAVIGIARLFYPYFKTVNQTQATSYLYLKCLEGSLMVASGISFLTGSLQHIRSLIYGSIHLYAFILSGFIFYWLLFKSKLIPKFIAIWGLLAISTLLLITVANLVTTPPPQLEYFLILIITNEVFLAYWLIVKGFNPDLVKTG